MGLDIFPGFKANRMITLMMILLLLSCLPLLSIDHSLSRCSILASIVLRAHCKYFRLSLWKVHTHHCTMHGQHKDAIVDRDASCKGFDVAASVTLLQTRSASAKRLMMGVRLDLQRHCTMTHRSGRFRSQSKTLFDYR